MNDSRALLEAQKHELAVHVRAGAGLVAIETRDEPRALDLLRHVARETLRPLFIWTATRGLSRGDRESAIDGSFDQPLELLRHIDQRRDGGIFVLADFQPWLDDPVIARMLRELARNDVAATRTLVLIGAELRLPEPLRARAMRFELQPPARDELESMVREQASGWSDGRGKAQAEVCEEALQALVDNLAGLTMKDARRLARNAIYDDGVLGPADLPELMKAKFELLDPGGALSFELETERFADVAGLPNLKRWLDPRAAVFRAADPPPGLDPPRGLLLLGVQGCGKSLTARAIAGRLGVPLLQLDAGALYDRFHGESERRLRESLAAADRLAPCVLWMATGDNDGGTSRRMLATLLTWMAERKSRVFLAATANDISRLPPELVRKGRFDEIFFLDLPDLEVRAEILRIHLRRRGLKPELYDVDTLARHSEGFSGAELEHAVVAGQYAAHGDGAVLSNTHILDAIRGTRPLAVVMAEPIAALRQWARTRAVHA
jgi:hypothetical protein